MVEIKNWETKEVIYASLSDTICGAVMECKRDGISLVKADLRDAELYSLDLSGMDFTEANFFRAKLSGTSFTDARMELANFSESDLTSVSFAGAVLDWADFGGANITNILWEHTRLIVCERHIPRAIYTNHCCQINIGGGNFFTSWISQDYKVFVRLHSSICRLQPIPFYEAFLDQKRAGNHFGLLALRMIDLWLNSVRYDHEFQDYKSLAPLN